MMVRVIPLYVTRKTLDLARDKQAAFFGEGFDPDSMLAERAWDFIPGRLKYRDCKAEEVFEIHKFPCDEHWAVVIHGVRQERFYIETEVRRANSNRLLGKAPFRPAATSCRLGDKIMLSVRFEMPA